MHHLYDGLVGALRSCLRSCVQTKVGVYQVVLVQEDESRFEQLLYHDPRLCTLLLPKNQDLKFFIVTFPQGEMKFLFFAISSLVHLGSCVLKCRTDYDKELHNVLDNRCPQTFCRSFLEYEPITR